MELETVEGAASGGVWNARLNFYTLKYVEIELGEHQDLICEVSIDMFSEHGCGTAYNDYPGREESIPIIIFTREGIENVLEALGNCGLGG